MTASVKKLDDSPQNTGPQLQAKFSVVALLILAGLLLYSYGTTLGSLEQRWRADPNYSYGYLVPAFALAILWFRHSKLAVNSIRPNWWGLSLLVIGAALRLAGAYFYYDSLDHISLLPTVAGLVVLVSGWAGLRWSWPAVGFLVFMFPLPYFAEVAMAHPLQRIATHASTYALQTIGFPAFSEGNRILLEGGPIEVAEACSGLRMLVVFFALSTAVALLAQRPLWERAFVLASAVPIAIISNVARITATGVVHETVGSEMANWVFHDVAGWLMMPFAVGLMWLELVILAHLFIVIEKAGPLPVGGRASRARVGPGRAQVRTTNSQSKVAK